VFRHHLDFGIMTVNEARARLNLPPVKDGDVRATPAAPTESIEMRAPDVHKADSPLAEGFDFAEKIAEHYGYETGKQIEPELERVLKIIDGATDFGEVRKLLLEAYGAMDLDSIAMAEALILGELNGRHSADGET